MIHTIDGILEAAKGGTPGVIAVAAAHDDAVLQAVSEARKEGIATPILVGHVEEISAMLKELGEDPATYEIIPGDSDVDCAEKAVALCAEGKAHFLMKGILGTADLMRAVFNKEHGLRTGHLTTHCMFYEIPAYGKMLILTDGGVNTFPDLDKKAEILENAAMVLQALGYETINAACVCGAEVVNPKIQSTVDADALSKMTDRWAKYHMNVCGPVALDLAISKEACHHKHYTAPGAGDADILLVPNYEVGNGIGKAASYFGNAKNAGVILGARVPIVLVSRSDSAYSKLASIAAGSVLAAAMDLG
ncbi:MAG: phosphate acyltransferase [Oscillibacter sp.]|nr:phosphate acyltransferase [Oscillibacter sp.]